MDKIKLKSGFDMPVVGLGTWQNKGEECREAVKKAIELGYRHIDTAWVYENQKEVGEGIKESNVGREGLFITSKVWYSNLKYEEVLEQCEETLKELDLEYLDLYLIHWPNENISMEDTFRALNELVDKGKVKSIGVSNFTIDHLRKAMEFSKISVNQVEYHPYLNQEELLKFCKENEVVITAYSPLGHGEVLSDKVLKKIAENKGKEVAQIVLKWLVQKGMIVIPKARGEDHLKDNFEIFDFELNDKEMEKINNLDKGLRTCNPSFAEF